MSRWIFPSAGFLPAVLLLVSSLSATSVRTVNLPEMVELADRIFLGRCVSVEYLAHPTKGFPVVEYSFQVYEAVKGVESGSLVVFRQLRSEGAGAGVAGLPSYRKGQEAMLFLHADSRLGLTSPVGFGQGVFAVERRSDGERGLVNADRNRNLVYNLTDENVRRLGLDKTEVEEIRRGEAVPAATFGGMIRGVELRMQELEGRW